MSIKIPSIEIINSINKFKSIPEIKSAFNELFNLDLSKPNYDKIRKKVFDSFKNLPIVEAPINKELLSELVLYRARPAEQIDKVGLNFTSSFGAPPIKKDIGIQRANWRRRNVFYGADSQRTALLETKRFENGEDFYLGKWRFDSEKLQLESYDFRVIFNEQLPIDNQWHILTNGFIGLLEFLKGKYGKEFTERFNYLHKRICDLFLIDDDKYYPLTAFIADFQLFNKYNTHKDIYFPFIIYPSVIDGFNSCNFAIHPSIVENYMYLENVAHVSISDDKIINNILDIKKFGVVKNRHKVEWLIPVLDINSAKIKIPFLACRCGLIVWEDKYQDVHIKQNDKTIAISTKVREIINSDPEIIPQHITFDGQNFSSTYSISCSYYLENCIMEIDNTEHKEILVNFQLIVPFTNYSS